MFGKIRDTLNKFNTKKFNNSYSSNDIMGVFDELESSYVNRRNLEKKSKSIEKQLEVVKNYSQLSKNDLAIVAELVKEYKGTKEVMQSLRGRLVKNNKSLHKIAENEETVPIMIDDLKSIDREVKDIQRDLFYLQDEKETLITKRNKLIIKYGILKYSLVIATSALFGSILISLNSEYFMETYLGVCVIVYFMMLGIAIRCKTGLDKSISDNEILQHKAARYINKSKIKYFHSMNYLGYSFSKLGVDSVAKIDLYYNRLQKSKDSESAYKELNKKLLEIENSINSLFSKKGIDTVGIENLDELLSVCNKAGSVVELTKELDRLGQQLNSIVEYENTLKIEIEDFKKNNSCVGIIEDKMLDYENIVRALDKKDIKVAR